MYMSWCNRKLTALTNRNLIPTPRVNWFRWDAGTPYVEGCYVRHLCTGTLELVPLSDIQKNVTWARLKSAMNCNFWVITIQCIHSIICWSLTFDCKREKIRFSNEKNLTWILEKIHSCIRSCSKEASTFLCSRNCLAACHVETYYKT